MNLNHQSLVGIKLDISIIYILNKIFLLSSFVFFGILLCILIFFCRFCRYVFILSVIYYSTLLYFFFCSSFACFPRHYACSFFFSILHSTDIWGLTMCLRSRHWSHVPKATSLKSRHWCHVTEVTSRGHVPEVTSLASRPRGHALKSRRSVPLCPRHWVYSGLTQLRKLTPLLSLFKP